MENEKWKMENKPINKFSIFHFPFSTKKSVFIFKQLLFHHSRYRGGNNDADTGFDQ